MRKIEITLAISPAELRYIASAIEEGDKGIKLHWYHTDITFVDPASIKSEPPYDTTPLVPEVVRLSEVQS